MILKKTRRAVVLDVHEEYREGVRIRSLDALVDFITKNINGAFRVLYSSPGLIENVFDDDSEFNRLCFFLSHVTDFVLVLDEVNFYTNAKMIPLEFSKIITQGRRQFIDVVGAVRRKSETNNVLTSQANIVVSFRQRLPEDVQYLEKYVGDLAKEIPELPKLEFIYATDYETGRDKVNFEGRENDFLKKLDMNGAF